jgi:NAD(P)H-flavin reductase
MGSVYACGNTPMIGDVVECLQPPAYRPGGEFRKLQKQRTVGQRLVVIRVSSDGFVSMGPQEFFSKPSRFKLIQRHG